MSVSPAGIASQLGNFGGYRGLGVRLQGSGGGATPFVSLRHGVLAQQIEHIIHEVLLWTRLALLSGEDRRFKDLQARAALRFLKLGVAAGHAACQHRHAVRAAHAWRAHRNAAQQYTETQGAT